MDLVNKYFDILKRNKDLIEQTPDHFLNVFFVEAANEMGKSEAEAVKALCASNNDFMNAIALLDLKKHQYIEYYVEELSKEVRCFDFFSFIAAAAVTKNIVLQEHTTHNLLVNLISYLKKRVERCTSYCISCGKKLLDDSVRLSPCTSEFCMFKFEEIFGVKLYPELQTNLPLVELDLSLTAKAVFSNRVLDILEPFPSFFLKEKEERKRSVFGATGANKVAVGEVKKDNKDIPKIKKLFKVFPGVRELIYGVSSEVSFNFEPLIKLQADLKEKLKANYPAADDLVSAYKFATYVIATNRLSLRKLEERERIPQFPAEYTQFAVTNLNPEFERKFEISKKKFGSSFLFHGSGQENWYSILRNGLRVLSNTKYMTCGAAYGAGVYASDQV